MDDQQLFANSTTLQVFLYLRQRDIEEIGVRELQRELDFLSPSTASWHINKLEEAGLALKLGSNKFTLTDKGRNLYTVDIPVNMGHYFLRGRLIAPYNLLLFFHSILLLVLCYFWIIKRSLVEIAVTSSLGIVLSFFLILIFWVQIHTKEKPDSVNENKKCIS